mmetsp:Transcript_11388/g.30163  ORF Transcript_11388/g.30163 Transcript_11388/m.30163 type:complete len:170 (-) Transcript_11388:4821-5330(-)
MASFSWSAAALAHLNRLRASPSFQYVKREGRKRNFLFPHGVEDPSRIAEETHFCAKEKRIEGVVHFGSMTEGFPSMVHGGASATIADNALGTVAWLSGNQCVTGTLTMRYENMVPLSTDCFYFAKVAKIEGKKVYCEGQLQSIERTMTYSHFDAVFIKIKTHHKMALPS